MQRRWDQYTLLVSDPDIKEHDALIENDGQLQDDLKHLIRFRDGIKCSLQDREQYETHYANNDDDQDDQKDEDAFVWISMPDPYRRQVVTLYDLPYHSTAVSLSFYGQPSFRLCDTPNQYRLRHRIQDVESSHWHRDRHKTVNELFVLKENNCKLSPANKQDFMASFRITVISSSNTYRFHPRRMHEEIWTVPRRAFEMYHFGCPLAYLNDKDVQELERQATVDVPRQIMFFNGVYIWQSGEYFVSQLKQKYYGDDHPDPPTVRRQLLALQLLLSSQTVFSLGAILAHKAVRHWFSQTSLGIPADRLLVTPLSTANMSSRFENQRRWLNHPWVAAYNEEFAADWTSDVFWTRLNEFVLTQPWRAHLRDPQTRLSSPCPCHHAPSFSSSSCLPSLDGNHTRSSVPPLSMSAYQAVRLTSDRRKLTAMTSWAACVRYFDDQGDLRSLGHLIVNFHLGPWGASSDPRRAKQRSLDEDGVDYHLVWIPHLKPHSI